MEFKIRSTSGDSAEVGIQPLEVSGTTRKVLQAEIVRKVGEPRCQVRCSIFHQRKNAAAEWEDLERVNLSKLRAGEGVALHLHTDGTSRLIQALSELKAVAERRGIRFGQHDVIVADRDTVVPVARSDIKGIIQKLVQANLDDEFWKALADTNPDVVKKLSYAQLHLDREKALRIFELHLAGKDWDEPQWEKLFYENQWIFGYGLRYQFLGMLKRQANYGGKAFTGKGEQRGEFLMQTSGIEKFTVLIEIKRPDTNLFQSGSFRSGVPNFSSDLIQSISQAQVNPRTWDTEGSRRERDRENLASMRVNTISPRSILVIGNTGQLDTFDKKNAFELLRTNLRSPDIITFDELRERAKYIVEQTGQCEAEGSPITDEAQEPTITDEDIPF